MASLLRWSNSGHLLRPSSLLTKRLNHTVLPTAEIPRPRRSRAYKIKQLGAQYIRTIEMFARPSDIIPEARVLKDAAQNGELTSEQQRQWTVYQQLLQVDASIPEECSTEDGLNSFTKLMQTGMCFAKAVDNRNILSRLPTWWNDICSHTGMEPGMGPIPQEKTKRGFSDLVCGMLLCPVELNWDDVQVREQLRTGTANINGEAVDVTDWPKFLHSSPINQDRPWLTFLRGPLLVRAYRHVFTSPSSAMKEGDPVTSSTSTRPSHAEMYDMVSVTRASIAYIATETLFGLTSLQTFTNKNRNLDVIRFYNSLIEYLFDPAFEPQVKDLLDWWNAQIFPTPYYSRPQRKTITAHQRMREALLASEADSQH